MPLSRFHPVIERWFASRFAEPTEPQRRAWPVIQQGGDVLIAAPTGSGKTFAAFLSAIDGLVRQGLNGELTDEMQVVYVSPLKALSNDVQKNLSEPLAEIRATLEEQGLPDVEVRTLVRTGDTPQSERQAMLKRRDRPVPGGHRSAVAHNCGRRPHPHARSRAGDPIVAAGGRHVGGGLGRGQHPDR